MSTAIFEPDTLVGEVAVVTGAAHGIDHRVVIALVGSSGDRRA